MTPIAVTLLDTQQTTLRVTAAIDADGNPCPLAGKVVFSDEDTTGGLVLTDNGDGTALVKSAALGGHLGTFKVSATDGVGSVEFDITVTADVEASLLASADPPVART